MVSLDWNIAGFLKHNHLILLHFYHFKEALLFILSLGKPRVFGLNYFLNVPS